MLKASGTQPDGRPLIVLGLSYENVIRLKNGDPIDFPLDDLGVAADVAIFYGKTEEEMRQTLIAGGLVNHRTRQVIDPRTREAGT
jgi:hypothetical protein